MYDLLIIKMSSATLYHTPWSVTTYTICYSIWLISCSIKLKTLHVLSYLQGHRFKPPLLWGFVGKGMWIKVINGFSVGISLAFFSFLLVRSQTSMLCSCHFYKPTLSWTGSICRLDLCRIGTRTSLYYVDLNYALCLATFSFCTNH